MSSPAHLIAGLIKLVIDPGVGTLTVHWGEQPIEFLAPQWFYGFALAPYFFVVRAFSLTDVSVLQQVLAAGFRTALVAGLFACLARPVWITEDNKVAVVALVDVSDSISDKQLEAARGYVNDLVEKRSHQDPRRWSSPLPRDRASRRAKMANPVVARHAKAGAGSDLQSAMQLAYGLFPDGYLPPHCPAVRRQSNRRRLVDGIVSRRGSRRSRVVAQLSTRSGQGDQSRWSQGPRTK